MTRPRLKSTIGTAEQPHTAAPAAPRTAVGGPKVVGRQAVPSGSGPRPTTVTGPRSSRPAPVAWLHIVAPRYQGAAPTATSTCACGWRRQAAGVRQVLALVADHTDHRTTCPLRHRAETRNAA